MCVCVGGGGGNKRESLRADTCSLNITELSTTYNTGKKVKCVTRKFDWKSGISGTGWYMYKIGQNFL